MPVINSVAHMKDELSTYRRTLHENPQTAYEEEFAASFVAEKLTEWGIPFKSGIAKTGILATIEGQESSSGKSIAFRGDMDALDIEEKTGLAYKSQNPGKMHACGHDGHTTNLLGLAKYLQDTKAFNGTVHLIFQPAEEGQKGAYAMIEDGLFDDIECDYVFGMHNWPWLPVGKAETRVGALTANVGRFDIEIRGDGGHAAMPHQTIDPVVAAAQLTSAIQTIVSRNVDPVSTAVVSITNLHSGTGAFNIIADSATLNGTIRTFDQQSKDIILKRIEELSKGIAAAHGCAAEVEYSFSAEAVINTEDGVTMAAEAAADIIGAEHFDKEGKPYMIGEDFGAYLQQKPGAFILIGQGVSEKDSPHNQGLHSPFYDFNDDILPIGISLFAKIAENYMPLS